MWRVALPRALSKLLLRCTQPRSSPLRFLLPATAPRQAPSFRDGLPGGAVRACRRNHKCTSTLGRHNVSVVTLRLRPPTVLRSKVRSSPLDLQAPSGRLGAHWQVGEPRSRADISSRDFQLHTYAARRSNYVAFLFHLPRLPVHSPSQRR